MTLRNHNNSENTLKATPLFLYNVLHPSSKMIFSSQSLYSFGKMITAFYFFFTNHLIANFQEFLLHSSLFSPLHCQHPCPGLCSLTRAWSQWPLHGLPALYHLPPRLPHIYNPKKILAVSRWPLAHKTSIVP